jgi:hypothetical protein
MESFKAANPHATLEDFVRWHSPRDWVDDGHGGGKLSARMMEPGNLWQELWKVLCYVNVHRYPTLIGVCLFTELVRSARPSKTTEAIV